MTYDEIISKIISLRDEINNNYEQHKKYLIKRQLDEIRELIDSVIVEDQTQLIDKISVYEFLADMYNETGRLKLSIDCYGETIDLACQLMDENRCEYKPLKTFYCRYIANRYLLDGNESSDLDNDLYVYFDQEGLDMKETTLDYYKTALKHNPVEDSDEYLNVIDEVEQQLYEQLNEKFDDDDYQQIYFDSKKKLLKEKYNIDWSDPKSYSNI